MPAAPDTVEEDSREIVLCLGDSLTAGFGVEPEQAWPALVQAEIDARGWPFRVVNAGISGDTTSAGRSRIGWYLDQPLAVLILELGGNDGLRGMPASLVKENLAAILAATREAAPDADLILAGMLAPPNMGPEYTREFREVFPALADENPDLTLIPFFLEGIAAEPDMNLADGIHPSPAGHVVLSRLVFHYLEPLLQRRLE